MTNLNNEKTMYAAISCDIVSSTSLSKESMVKMNELLKQCLSLLEKRYDGFWGRVVRGDAIECLLAHPEDAFEVALILKTWVKGSGLADDERSERFSRYGLRIAIGIGGMKTIDRDLDMMDGDAIYRSGRALDRLVGHSKYSFVLDMGSDKTEESLVVMLSLVNQLLNNTSARRCEILCQRLLAANSTEVAQKMGISVSGVNQSLNQLGWTTLEQAIMFYRKTMEVWLWKV